MLRRLIVVTLALGMLAVGATGAFAANPNATPTSFEIGAGQCPQLGDVSVHGDGTITWVVHGSNVTSFASGTATDSIGNTYKFNYNLTWSTLDNRVILTDHFNLVGSSGETIRAHFVARFDKYGVLLLFKEHGEPVSDPFTFAPVCDPL